MNLNGVDITISIQMLCAMNEIDMYALFAQRGGMGSNDLYLVYLCLHVTRWTNVFSEMNKKKNRDQNAFSFNVVSSCAMWIACQACNVQSIEVTKIMHHVCYSSSRLGHLCLWFSFIFRKMDVDHFVCTFTRMHDKKKIAACKCSLSLTVAPLTLEIKKEKEIVRINKKWMNEGGKKCKKQCQKWRHLLMLQRVTLCISLAFFGILLCFFRFRFWFDRRFLLYFTLHFVIHSFIEINYLILVCMRWDKVSEWV